MTPDDRSFHALGTAMWNGALLAVLADPALTTERFVAVVMRQLAEVRAEQPDAEADDEGFERAIRARLAAWWPEVQARAARLRAMGVVPVLVAMPNPEDTL